MSIKGQKYAARRDANDHPIKIAAEQMGWWLIRTDEPCDYWAALKSRPELGFRPIEIKTDVGVFTAAQEQFLLQCQQWRIPYMVWRSVEEMIEQTNTLRAAK